MPHIYKIPFLNPDYFFNLFSPPSIELTEDDIFEADWLQIFVRMLAEDALSSNPMQTKEATENEIAWFLEQLESRHLKVNDEPTSGAVPIQQARIIEVERGLKTLYKILRDESINQNLSEEDQIKKKKIKKNRSLTYYDLKEQIDQCAIGFHNRVVKCINRFKCPTNLLEILTQYRESLLAEIPVRIDKELPAILLNRGNSKEDVDKVMAELIKEGIHLDRIIHTIAHPIVGTTIINATDYVGLPIEDADVRYFLRKIFQEKYQIFSIVNGVLAEIKTFLTNQGCYNGFNNTELGYRELDYGQMVKLTSQILEMEPATDILLIDENGAIRDLNTERLLQLIFETMLNKNILNLDTETEELFHLLARFFRARATASEEEPLTLKAYITSQEGLSDSGYKIALQRIKQIAPHQELGLNAMIDFLEFFCPYLLIGDIDDFMEVFSPEFFAGSDKELVENFFNYSSNLQRFLISYLPANVVMSQSQSENDNNNYFRPNFLQFAIKYLPIEKIDLVLNKMMTLPFFCKKMILANLTPQYLDYLFDENNGNKVWRYYLLTMLSAVAVNNNKNDYDFSISEKQKIYINLFDVIVPSNSNSKEIKSAIYSLFSLKTSFLKYSDKSSSVQVIASHLSEDEHINFLTNKNEALEKISNLSEESLAQLTALLDEEEKGSVSEAEFHKKFQQFIDEAPYFFWNWMIFEPVNVSKNTRLRNVLSKFSLIINNKLPAENIIDFFKYTNYCFYLIMHRKIKAELFKSDIEAITRFIKAIESKNEIYSEIALDLNNQEIINEFTKKSKIFMRYFFKLILSDFYNSIFFRLKINTFGETLKLLNPTKNYYLIAKLIESSTNFLNKIILNKEDFFNCLNQLASFEGLNICLMIALKERVPFLINDISDICLLSRYLDNTTLSNIIDNIISNKKSLFFIENKENKEGIIKLYWIRALLSDPALQINEVIEGLPLSQSSHIKKSIDEFLYDKEKFISILKSLPIEYKKHLIDFYWDIIKPHVINTVLDNYLSSDECNAIKKVVYEKILGDNAIALSRSQYCQILKNFSSINKTDEIENMLFDFFISQEKIKIETKEDFESVFVELSNDNANKFIKMQDAEFFNSIYKENDFASVINFFADSDERVRLFLEKITDFLKSKKFEYFDFKKVIEILNEKAPMALPLFIESIDKNHLNEMAENNFYQFSEIINLINPLESNFNSFLNSISNENLKSLLDCYLVRPPEEIQSKALEMILELKKFTPKKLFSMSFSKLRLRNLFSSVIKQINFEKIIHDIDDIKLIDSVLLKENKKDFFNDGNFNENKKIMEIFFEYSECQSKEKKEFFDDENRNFDYYWNNANLVVDNFFASEYTDNQSLFDNIIDINNESELSEEESLYNLANDFLFYGTNENENSRLRRTKLESARLFSSCIDNTTLKNVAKDISVWPRCYENTKMSDYYKFILEKIGNLNWNADSDFAELVVQAKTAAEKFSVSVNKKENVLLSLNN